MDELLRPEMRAARARQTCMLEEAARQIDAGSIKVFDKNIFSLEEIAQAHQFVESGHSIGKTVVKIKQLDSLVH